MEILEADSADYKVRQSREEIEYAKSYREWVESLPPQERRELAALNLDKPHAPGYSSGTGLDIDVADLAVFEEVAAPAEGEEIHDWQTAADLRTAEVIAKLVSEILATDPSITIECLALVTGVGYLGSSESDLARKYGLTRAAVSKKCIELSERLGIKNHRAMRTQQAREVYADRAIEAHRAAGREVTGETPRAQRVETLGMHSSRAAAVWRRVKKSEWIRYATAAELLLARRSLRPCFEIAHELTALIRAKDDRAILRELNRDLATPP